MASVRSIHLLSIASDQPRCSSAIATGMHLRFCKFNHHPPPPHFTRHLIFTAAADNHSISTDPIDDHAPSPSPPSNSSFNFYTSVGRFRQIVSTFPPPAFLIQRPPGADFLLGFCVATVCLVIGVRIYVVRRLSYNHPGTVADLVRRGQLRSDRRGISEPMKYDDPFNNPLVKVSKGNSTVEMCGKVYRMAPVTLTEQQRSIHQKRRSRAYQWKRPKVFLKEGDAIPPDVELDTIRWIPANHPFATTASDIDEDLAQNNVYQKHGVPFRIQAEHEALQKKLEALQKDQKLNELYIDSQNAKDFERAYRKQEISNDRGEKSPENDQISDAEHVRSDESPDCFNNS